MNVADHAISSSNIDNHPVMEFANNVIGPDFDKADLVSFDFGDVDLTMRLPEHGRRLDKPLAPNDLSHISDEQWEIDEHGNRTLVLVDKNWTYENKVTFDNVFLTNVTMVLRQIPTEARKKSVPLNKQAFANWILETWQRCVFLMEQDSPSTETFAQAVKDWQIPEQISDMEKLSRDEIDWYITKFGHISIGEPDPFIFIPINNQYVIHIIINATKVSYSDRKDTFPEKDIEPVKRQIMLEFLDHLQVTYSPELLKDIKRQNVA